MSEEKNTNSEEKFIPKTTKHKGRPRQKNVDPEVFGRNLKAALFTEQKSQTEMAKKMKISSGAANNWCSGKNAPDIKKITALSKWLGINKQLLMDGSVEDVIAAAKEMAPNPSTVTGKKRGRKPKLTAVISSEENSVSDSDRKKTSEKAIFSPKTAPTETDIVDSTYFEQKDSKHSVPDILKLLPTKSGFDLEAYSIWITAKALGLCSNHADFQELLEEIIEFAKR
ncbi:helix-turn-helix domain-containing protein [Butyrivibrio sp. NC3005]|uniref:helix-turn-helix domain-containing protein n=1 Tax=Butyrivibrio sp. NC3005 TaxID=1280685 RepID=UPI00040A4A95|nr:helix-turn-helix transcriptional regulator [Butyrivibrio sp. NC3005]